MGRRYYIIYIYTIIALHDVYIPCLCFNVNSGSDRTYSSCARANYIEYTGTFRLSMEFTEEYPNKPPTVKFLSRIFHPNGASIAICDSLIN